MNIFSYVLIILMPQFVRNYETFTETQIDLVVSLAEYFSTSFCIFGQEEEYENLMPKKTESRLSENLLTGWLTFPEISEFIFDSPFVNYGGRTMIIIRINENSIKALSQLSETINLSSAVWVAFSNDPIPPDTLQTVFIPFDCNFIYVTENNTIFSLTELYKISNESSVETFNLGNWTKENGLLVSRLSFYMRRNNLKGCKLKGIIKNNPPYVSIEKDEEGNPKFGGYLYEIWSELEFRINFSTEFPEAYFNENLEGVLSSGEVDFAVTRISNEPYGFEFMDLSQPIDEAKFYMFGHRPGSELDWDSYLKPFSANTWYVNLGWMMLSSLALAVLYNVAWNFGTSEKEANYYIFTFSESLLTVFRAICMQGSDVTPRSSSCRLFFLSIYLTALVVTSAFSAALFSLLTIPKPRFPFSSLDEVLNNKRFKIGLPSDSDFYKTVEDYSYTLPLSTQFKLLEKIIQWSEGLQLTAAEELERLCRDKMYVFLYDLPNVLYLMQNMTRNCQDKILPSGPPLFKKYIGFGFRKHNPYKRLINFHLIRMKNEGILNRLMLNYWPPQIPTVQVTWVRVTLSDISPILYMFASGVILGGILLYVEKIVLHFRKRNIRVSAVSLEKLLLNQKITLYKNPINRNEKNAY